MNERILLLASRIKDNWTLCSFAGMVEKEVMIAQTIHAAVRNLEEHGEAFSIRGGGVFSSSGFGLVDNNRAYRELLADGLFREEARTIDGTSVTVIFPTKELLSRLEDFLDKE